ncbi:MAG: hypothetical protein ACI837_001309 [Crocinitomicaceae bacterium]|jgi:hypothetical protein
MKHLLLSLSLAVLANFGQAQISKKHQKKIDKIVGSWSEHLPVQKLYPLSDVCAECEVVASSTNFGDTTGVTSAGEYVLFRSPIHYTTHEEKAKLISEYPVAVEEYEQFQNDVIDSIACEKIYYCLEEDWVTKNYLNYSKVFMNDDDELEEFDPSDRRANRLIFPLNRDRKFEYDDRNLIPCLSEMYLIRSGQFYRPKEFDKRKLNYLYTDVNELKTAKIDKTQARGSYSRECYKAKALVLQEVNVLNDDFVWARQAEHDNDELGILGQLYSKGLKESPVIGVLGTQAAAFCHWKEEQLQREINRKKLPYNVVVTLPTSDDLDSVHELHNFVIEQRDYTNQWRISNDEYDHFIDVVQDSIIREYLYHHLAEFDHADNYLDWDEIYFDEGAREYVEYDCSDRSLNRELFALNYDSKIKMNNYEVRGLVEECYEKIKKNPTYVYNQNLSMNRSVFGEFEKSTPIKNHECINMKLKPRLNESGNLQLGYDLNLGSCNSLGQSSGVRGHKDLSKFIERHEVPLERLYSHRVNPPNELDLALDVSYEQALAYYHWLYPIHSFGEGDDWRNFVFPSKEQYELILAGKSVVVPEKVINYPSPVFRYVVHIYGK